MHARALQRLLGDWSFAASLYGGVAWCLPLGSGDAFLLNALHVVARAGLLSA
jgi:hypothetical protein